MRIATDQWKVASWEAPTWLWQEGWNRKGCDIGYALAANSCEGAHSVDACTVTALDAITAFAGPDPNCSSQNQSVFSGLVAHPVTLLSGITQPTSDRQRFIFANPFSRRRAPP